MEYKLLPIDVYADASRWQQQQLFEAQFKFNLRRGKKSSNGKELSASVVPWDTWHDLRGTLGHLDSTLGRCGSDCIGKKTLFSL